MGEAAEKPDAIGPAWIDHGNTLLLTELWAHTRSVTSITDEPVGFTHGWIGMGMVMRAYEDNFGFWDVDGPLEQAFFQHIQRKSILVACERCKCRVRLIPPKTLCASCVSALECGAPRSMNQYGDCPITRPDPGHPPRRSLPG